MQVIVLAGGKGTRLQSVVNDVPKPMADINGKPFLKYIFEYLSRFDVFKIILSVGYKQEIIKQYFKNNYKNISIVYSSEETSLGTGGAIKQALDMCDDEYAIVLNGDTFCNININEFYNRFDSKKNIMTIALKKMKNVDRYGSVDIKNDKVILFNEKKYYKEAFINAGIYIVKKNIFEGYDLDLNFSFEEFLEKNIQNLNISPYVEDNNYFIDIGIPSDYKKAQIDFKELF